MIRRQSRHREKNVTVSLRRCLFLYVAWLSQSAYDARMVNIAVGILLESVNHDMADLSVPNFVVGSKPPVLVRGKKVDVTLKSFNVSTTAIDRFT